MSGALMTLSDPIIDLPGSTGRGSSIYAPLSRHEHLSVHRLRKSTLISLSWAMEDQFCARADRPVLFAAFQQQHYFEQSRRRWEKLGRLASQAFVLADFDQTHRADDLNYVAVPPGSPLSDEWVIVCDSAELPVVLAAVEVPGQESVPELDRLFDAVWTMDPETVRDASRICAEISLAYGAEDARPLLYHLADRPRPGVITPADASELFLRIMAYLDRFGVQDQQH
jgi:MerR family transcriptional regulator, light-induced transcriptional regulator